MAIPEKPEWMDDAACAGEDTNLFYPLRGEGASQAKAICRRCPVRQECLEFALSTSGHEDFGIWGGLAEKERIRIRRARKRGVA